MDNNRIRQNLSILKSLCEELLEEKKCYTPEMVSDEILTLIDTIKNEIPLTPIIGTPQLQIYRVKLQFEDATRYEKWYDSYDFVSAEVNRSKIMYADCFGTPPKISIDSSYITLTPKQ